MPGACRANAGRPLLSLFADAGHLVPIADGMSTTTDHHGFDEAGLWVSVAEAAARLQVHSRTVERRVAAGTMRSRTGDHGRVEVFVPGEPEPEAQQGAPRVEVHEPDRQLVLSATAMRTLQGAVAEAREDLASARRVGMAGWATAAAVGLGAAGILIWGSWRWASDRGALDLATAEARIEAEAAERLATHLEQTVEAERQRIATLESRLAAAGEEQARLAAALAVAHERGDALRSDLADALAAADSARQAARQDAGRATTSRWWWQRGDVLSGALVGHTPDTTPDTDSMP